MRSLLILWTFALVGAAGCSQQAMTGGSNGASELPAGRSNAKDRIVFRVVYRFTGQGGATPRTGVVVNNGLLYGTTTAGGATGTKGDGTVYELNSDGTEHVLHSFTGNPDGSEPRGNLVLDDHGAMYGTTEYGGTKHVGTVYEIRGDGAEHVVYSFRSAARNKTYGPDGALPLSSLVVIGPDVLGTTLTGGKANGGTVFEVERSSGYESFIYPFTGMPDGSAPLAGLTALNSVFYGTTANGGDNDKGCVFSINASGTERVLYSFKGSPSDGAAPYAGLIVDNDLLYGVTTRGGAYDDGTVFQIDQGGKERVVAAFSGSDGRQPYGGLAIFDGLLYGTTEYGGTSNNGTVFEVRTDGAQRVLHNFQGGADGRRPEGTLTVLNGALFGTTAFGGTNDLGTVFELIP
jgi:uncharacterized repeat protein (TIGR03803 family)